MGMNRYINHTLLKADAAYGKIEALCAEAREYDFTNVYVNSYWASACAELLKGTGVKVCTVVGFPLGAMSTKTKAFETAAAIADGAKEVGMVLNIGEVKAGHYDTVRADVKAVVEAAKGDCVKVILENCLLAKEEVVEAYELCVKAGAAFVRASTGFSTSGVIPEGTGLVKGTVKGCCLVKAAGEVRCYEDMEKMVEAEADRIGASVGIRLMQKETSDGGY